MKKTTEFARIQFPLTQIMEKPLQSWTSGKIKRIYDSYESFCFELGKLLDPNPSRRKVDPDVTFLDDESSWKDLSQEQKDQQLMTILSAHFSAGFLIKTTWPHSKVRSYFFENTNEILGPILEGEVEELIPKIDDPLKPQRLSTQAILDRLSLSHLTFVEPSETLYFPLNPDEGLAVLLVTKAAEPLRQNLALKTQNLIQRQYFD